MATTVGPEVRTIADIVQVLTRCTKQEADAAELEICKSTSSVATLLAACGIATASVGFGGRLIVGGAATYGSTVIPGLLLTGAGVIGARSFCKSAIERSKATFSQELNTSGD